MTETTTAPKMTTTLSIFDMINGDGANIEMVGIDNTDNDNDDGYNNDIKSDKEYNDDELEIMMTTTSHDDD
jgi:hypothetical protein